LLPGARAASFAEARAGLRPATPDGLPAIGPLRAAPRVVMATGHYRNGILLAPLTAELVAGYLLDQKSDPVFAITSPDRLLV
jgi:glycine oxidase